MTTGLIVIATGIVICVSTAIWYLYDEYKTYQDKYEWARSQRDRARQELFEVKLNLVKANKIIEKLEQDKPKSKQVTMNVNVNTDEVVSKVMQGVNKKIEDIKKKEQVYIKVDGKEININEVKKIMKEVGKRNLK